MKAHTVVGAAWFIALVVFFAKFRNGLPLWAVFVLTIGALVWMEFFLGPSVYRWISGSSSNGSVGTATWIFGITILLIWLLVLSGSLVFWMPYLRGILA